MPHVFMSGTLPVTQLMAVLYIFIIFVFLFVYRVLTRLLNQAFHQIGHPLLGQHIQLVSVLHHICTEQTAATQV